MWWLICSKNVVKSKGKKSYLELKSRRLSYTQTQSPQGVFWSGKVHKGVNTTVHAWFNHMIAEYPNTEIHKEYLN